MSMSSGPNIQMRLAGWSQSAVQEAFNDHMRKLLVLRGDWTMALYDLAWVLCTDFFSKDEQRFWLEHLLNSQNPDATWGDASYSAQSALIDTLTVCMAYVRLGQPIPRLAELQQGVVNRLIELASQASYHNLVAFEVLFPLLLRWLETQGVVFQISERSAQYAVKQNTRGMLKIEAIKAGIGWFNPESPLSHTAEFLALLINETFNPQELEKLILENGSIGASPAATAAAILLYRKAGLEAPNALYRYLFRTLRDHQGQGFPNLHPIETSRRLWNLRPWLLSGHLAPLLKAPNSLRLIRQVYDEVVFAPYERVAWDPLMNAMPDLDDTAVALALYVTLKQAGVIDLTPMSLISIKKFQRANNTFFCLPYELHSTPSVLLHTLMALDQFEALFGASAQLDQSRQVLLRQVLLDHQHVAELWNDKWHLTWTYAAQAWISVASVQRAVPELILSMAAEILRREQNGGWGEQSATVEESAYVISGLVALLHSEQIALSMDLKKEIHAALGRAHQFMYQQLEGGEFYAPALWISKTMYRADTMVLAAVYNALYALHDRRA
ncbi:MAG: hypothetical protein MUF87_13395 [Anaerolineae bacterium]|nr:hypothetical protein [Anaerolineae bacterium]